MIKNPRVWQCKAAVSRRWRADVALGKNPFLLQVLGAEIPFLSRGASAEGWVKRKHMAGAGNVSTFSGCAENQLRYENKQIVICGFLTNFNSSIFFPILSCSPFFASSPEGKNWKKNPYNSHKTFWILATFSCSERLWTPLSAHPNPNHSTILWLL